MRLVIASLGVLALAPGVGDAQDLAAEGAFTINFTSTVINGEPSISIGPDHKKGLYEGVLTASNAAGTGLLHQLTGRCVGIWEIDTKAGTFEQHGNCVYTDPEGDEIWEQFDFQSQPLSPVQIAAGKWIGGSGKYDGIRGEFEIRVRPLRPAHPDFGQVIGSKQGSYRIVAPD
jgi:hypothetical protein